MEEKMKPVRYFVLLAILAFVFSASAFAKDNHSGTFTIQDRVQVGSMQLAPGTYEAEWSGPANNLKVEILHNGKTVATAEGRIHELQQPSPYNAVAEKTLPNHAKELAQIQFGNRTEAVDLVQ
jgi:hypothetical protein